MAEIRSELGDFRQATTSSFTALREDLADLRSETRTGFTEMRGKFDHTAAGQDRIVALLNTLLDQDEHDEQQPASTGLSVSRRHPLDLKAHLETCRAVTR